MRIAVVIASALLSASCTAATWDAIGAAAAGAAAGMQSPYTVTSTKLMLFGGPDHRTYLGCLTCNEYATDSVLNTYGAHGSPYQANSIFNTYGQFGSSYSAYSACNPVASDPPVIVDGAGRFYGRLTVNAYHRQRTANPTFQALAEIACKD